MDIETIRGMISEHPFGISDAAIEEIVEAINEYGDNQFIAGVNSVLQIVSHLNAQE